MRRLKKFAGAPWRDKVLLFRAFIVILAVRIGLTLLPIRAVVHVVSEAKEGSGKHFPVERLVWAVRAMSRFVPLATCLTQAFALQWLLTKSGRSSRIHIGAKRDFEGRFGAHAWVEFDDRVVIGGPQTEDYVSLFYWER